MSELEQLRRLYSIAFRVVALDRANDAYEPFNEAFDQMAKVVDEINGAEAQPLDLLTR